MVTIKRITPILVVLGVTLPFFIFEFSNIENTIPINNNTIGNTKNDSLEVVPSTTPFEDQ